jgi:hypothetical protein
MLEALREIRQNMDYGRSELYSGQEGIPDYDCNSSGKSYLSNAESYLWNALDDLDKVIELVEGLNDGKYSIAESMELEILEKPNV